MLDPFARELAAPARFLRDLFFGTFAGTPKGDLGRQMEQRDVKRSQNGAQQITKMKENTAQTHARAKRI